MFIHLLKLLKNPFFISLPALIFWKIDAGFSLPNKYKKNISLPSDPV